MENSKFKINNNGGTSAHAHRVKDWDLVMCGREEGRRERGNERHTHSLTGSRIGT